MACAASCRNALFHQQHIFDALLRDESEFDNDVIRNHHYLENKGIVYGLHYIY
jgi:hypothetical protein